MDQTTDQVEQRIVQARHRLASNFQDLESKVDAAKDWRSHYANKPYLFLGAAFVAGFALSGGNGRGSGGVARVLKAQTGTETVDKFVGALTAVAVTRAKDYLEGRIPGFGNAFDNGRA